ncbi:MAG: hypothetical protein Q7R33_01370 [Nitrosarchaeum sp.]|nr:hypothetical protein [Nitrosarchaeum sp.]
MSGLAYNLSPELEKQLIQKRVDLRWQLSECAEWLSKILNRPVSNNGLSDWFKKKGLLLKDLGLNGAATVPVAELEVNVEEKVSTDKTIESYKAQAIYYKKLYSEAIKSSSGIDDIIRVAKEVTNAIPAVKGQTYKYEKIHTTSTQSVVAPLCDTHIGEVVDLKQMGGLNEYNIDIFNNRLYNWTEKVNELTNLRRSYTRIDDLFVPMLGDMVSGGIHQELLKTNEDNEMGQMIRGANLIAQSLTKLSSNFENVYVKCVPGNHGRMEVKPPAKNIYVSWDHMLYQWISAFCRNQKNIHFEIPKSFYHVFTVAGRQILIMHGDSIKGGFAGLPYYGFSRAAAYLRQSLQVNSGLSDDELLKSFDAMIIGHFHKHEELDLGTGPLIVAGCMKGTDEFAFAKLHVASRPSQICTFWHPKWGYISKDIIYLDRLTSDGRFEDTLSDVWMETKI